MMRSQDLVSGRARSRHGQQPSARRARAALKVEQLETRELLATAVVNGAVLQVLGTPGDDVINVFRQPAGQLNGASFDMLVVLDAGVEILRVPTAGLTDVVIDGLAGNDQITLDASVTQSALLVGNLGNDVLVGGAGPNNVLDGGAGRDRLIAGPGANNLLLGGADNDRLVGGPGVDVFSGGAGKNLFQNVGANDLPTINTDGGVDRVLGHPLTVNVVPSTDPLLSNEDDDSVPLTAAEVNRLLDRASAATPSRDGIIAIVDRNGRILGVRVEDQVAPNIVNDVNTLVFAIDGAVAKARTAAFFANNATPITSRTIQNISESTLTQREIESNPNIPDKNSTLRGPAPIAPLGINGHFPADIPFNPQVDLFQIEYTNRDGLIHPGFDLLRGTADDIILPRRFNINPALVPPSDPAAVAAGFAAPDKSLSPTESYGFVSGLFNGDVVRASSFQSRGIGTQPGGVPIFKVDLDGFQASPREGIEPNPITTTLDLVGGIGVFYPGTTGFATAENSSLDDFDRVQAQNSDLRILQNPDRALEAELVAFVAAGGASDANLPFPVVGGVNNLDDRGLAFDIPSRPGRIDLVGITLDVLGPFGLRGPGILVRVATALGPGVVNGANQPLLNIAGGRIPLIADEVDVQNAILAPNGTINGIRVPERFLVAPTFGIGPGGGIGLTPADVTQIIRQGIAQANKTRAAIRLPFDNNARMVLAVTDLNGNIIGLYRMPDSTIFSINVAEAKAKNAVYYSNANRLDPRDQVPGVPPGTALTARTFRFLGLPRFPEGIEGAPPGPFSQLNDDPGIDRVTGVQVGPRAPAAQFQSVTGFNAFNPQSNFRSGDVFALNAALAETAGVAALLPNPGQAPVTQLIANQSGIVFFPGSTPLYKDVNGDGVLDLVGGFGISGDGVDQDDVVTFFGAAGFYPIKDVLRSDQVLLGGNIRLPYQRFNRQPILGT